MKESCLERRSSICFD